MTFALLPLQSFKNQHQGVHEGRIQPNTSVELLVD